jgi:hypothetical protein
LHPDSSRRASDAPPNSLEATVAGYTITITPNDDKSGAQTTILVDTASGSARITEMTVRAGEGGGLSQVPTIDWVRLIAALGGSTGGSSAPAAAPARRGRPPASKRAGRKAPTPTKATRRSRAASSVVEDTERTGRAYRRMPEPAEVVAAYQESGGTTALARHYGVPRHTATGWIRRLRRLGLLEARG